MPALAAGLLLAIASPAIELPDLGDPSSGVLSPVMERKLGEQIMTDVRNDPGYLRDVEMVQYLNDLADRLLAGSPDKSTPITVFAVKDRSINAFALPGGFIGVHTGLLRSAQNESELAGVMGHEISHVTQRHIARFFEKQQANSVPMLLTLAVALLAARASPDLAAAAMTVPQALAMQSALNFSRDNEREADRLGYQMLVSGGFDPAGMAGFFARLQDATRFLENNAPAYLRTHPLTQERMADMQNRSQQTGYRQVTDSADFQLLRAKARAAEGNAREAVAAFLQLDALRGMPEPARRYGLAQAWVRAGDLKQAAEALTAARRAMPDNAIIESAWGRLLGLQGDRATEVFYDEATRRFPRSRQLVHDQARWLLDNGRADRANTLLQQQTRNYPGDIELLPLLARAYADTGRQLMSHTTLADYHAKRNELRAAIEQLRIAVLAGDGNFYEQSVAEARKRELEALERERKAERDKGR
ncbi:MAG: M48 family metallopeptidase [Rhodocyclaceae bacterium]|nr:M48 family metallopeptidase [Rhodocyclaceae bacterium]